MKTIKLALAVAALALGTTAFAFTGHTDPEKKPTQLDTYYYKNTGNGVYVQISLSEANPGIHCSDTPDANFCIVTSAEDMTSFTLNVNEPEDITPLDEAGPALYE